MSWLWTSHLPDTSQKHHCWTNLFGSRWLKKNYLPNNELRNLYHSIFIIDMKNLCYAIYLKILILDVVVLITTFLTVSARSICWERVHGVYCWSKPFWTDDFLPIGWLVGKSYGFHSPAPVVLFDCLHFVQCLLLNARDISSLSKILDAWISVLCWSKFRFVFTVFCTDTNSTHWGNVTQLTCCITLADNVF